MRKILLPIFGIVLAGAVAVTIYLDYGRPQKENGIVDTKPEAVATSSPEKSKDRPIVEIVGSVDADPKYKGQSLGYLGSSKELSVYPQEFVEAQRVKLASIIKLTKESPKDETNWIAIGLVKKVFNNYVGTRDAWEYAKILNPRASMSYYNLGKLYAAYLVDNKKAEANFLAALDLNAGVSDVYLALAEFYRDFYKEKYNQVDDVLLEGLNVAPLDLNLTLQLSFYYKDIGDKENAVQYFEKFLKLPNLTGTQQQAIEAELATLKK